MIYTVLVDFLINLTKPKQISRAKFSTIFIQQGQFRALFLPRTMLLFVALVGQLDLWVV